MDEFARLYAEKCGIYMPTENAALPKDAESGWEDIRTYIEEGNITTLPSCTIPAALMRESHCSPTLLVILAGSR